MVENASGAGLPPDEAIVDRLKSGDEVMFGRLLDTWSRGLLRAARGYVSTRESAEDVVQETWLAVLRGIDRFEGRASLRTWVYRILVNIAKTRGVKDSRTVPFADLAPGDSGPTVDPARFPRARRPLPRPLEAGPGLLAVGGDGDRAAGAPVADRPRRGRTAAAAADRDHPARHRGLQFRGGLRDPRDFRGQPAGTTASGPRRGAGAVGGVLQCSTVMSSSSW